MNLKNKNKNELIKQLEQEQNHRNGDHMEGYQWGGVGEKGGKGTGNKQHKWWIQNRQGEVKNNIGNREAKELICTTHGHGLKEGMLEGMGVQGRWGPRGEKNGTTVIA